MAAEIKTTSIATMNGIIESEVITHGIEHEQMFQGCSTLFSNFEDCATGCGNDAGEAFDDALECLAQNGWDIKKLECERPNPEEYESVLEMMNKTHPLEEEDFSSYHFYVSVRVK